MSMIKWESLDSPGLFFDDRYRLDLLRPACDLSVDVFEDVDDLVVKMNLPGVEKSDIEITVEGDVLTVLGRKGDESKVESKTYYSKEIRRGLFSRSIRLPKQIELKRAEARYDHGVLTITAPIVVGVEDGAIRVPIIQ